LKAEVEGKLHDAKDQLASERERSEGLLAAKLSLEARHMALKAETVSAAASKEELKKDMDLMTSIATKLEAELENTNCKLISEQPMYRN
jgi:hypothetical protein